ncbi:flippase [Marinilongibacter aquaticus]|uniref:flippase n=1 Tax=Marinilongibacter aquaticus TaxID=2975157 RepID=UPI0021BD40BF|nr:flippase [Marinilongibacter aquaticus]UBM60729.1 flippase [Marinilongibacter aquaticus]
MSKTEHTEGKNYWLVSGLLTLVQNFSGVLLGFASFYLLIRVLSKEEYGVWVLFMSTITILEAIRNGLIQTALVRYASASEKGEFASIITAAAFLNISVTVICIVLILIFAGFLARLWDSPKVEMLLYLFIISFSISGFLNLFNWIEQAKLNFKGIFVSNLIRQSIFCFFVLAVYFSSTAISLSTLVWVQILGIALAAIAAFFSVRKNLHFSLVNVRHWVKKLISYGKYGFGTSVSSLLSGTVDQMMLGAMLSPVASGAFNIAVRITNLVDIPTNAMAVIVFPQSAKRMASEGKEAIKYLYEKSVGTTLAILLPGLFLLYFFAEFTLEFIAGERYSASYPLLKVTLIYSILIPFGRQFGTIFDSIGKTKTTFYVVLFTTVANLLLNYFFIGQWGVMGAAYATLVSNIVGFAVAQVLLKREIAVSLRNVWMYTYKFYPEFFVKYIQPMWQKMFANKEN